MMLLRGMLEECHWGGPDLTVIYTIVFFGGVLAFVQERAIEKA